jgi:hypothetical protein
MPTMLKSYCHRPVIVRAIQFEPDDSNLDELAEYLRESMTPFKLGRDVIYLYAPGLVRCVEPGDFVFYLEGEEIPQVLNEESFRKLYEPCGSEESTAFQVAKPCTTSS